MSVEHSEELFCSYKWKVPLVSIVEHINDDHNDMFLIDAIRNGMNRYVRECGGMYKRR